MKLQPFCPGIFITILHIALTPQHGRHQPQAKGNLLRPGEQIIITEDGRKAIEWCRYIWKIEPAIGTRLLPLIKNHRMRLPLQSIFDVQLLDQLAHVAIGAKENV